jgi:hypothetical protein
VSRIDALQIDEEVSVLTKYSRMALQCVLAVFISSAVMLCGCGGSNSDGTAAANTEEGRRYNSLQKLGNDQTKQAIAAKKKQALAEIAQKKASQVK